MTDLPSRRSVHGLGCRSRLPDTVLVDGPGGRPMRVRGSPVLAARSGHRSALRGARGRERADGWVVLRDGVAVLVVVQLVWLVVAGLRPGG